MSSNPVEIGLAIVWELLKMWVRRLLLTLVVLAVIILGIWWLANHYWYPC